MKNKWNVKTIKQQKEIMMQKILLRKTFRELQKNFMRYFALFALAALSVFLVTGLAGTAWSITGTVESKAEENCLEDGEFVMSAPLSEEQEEVVGSMEFLLEDMFYLDFKQSDGSILRLMKNRERINQAEVSEGQVAQNENEIVLERIYAKTHGLDVGDTVVLGEREFTVSGIGTSADYELCVENLTDMAADGNAFGTAFVTLEAYRFLEESGQAARAEGIVYGFCLRPDTSQTDAPEGKSTADNEDGNSTDERMDELRTYLAESGGLLRFTESDRNPRIGAAVDDVQINIRASLTAGVIVLILLAFVISVFVVHSIDRESAVIGTLYAMGVKKGELMLSYTWLPVLVCLAGGVLGTALGFSPAAFLLLGESAYSYFSIPDICPVLNPWLAVYGIVLPALSAFLVNYLVIRSRLGSTALSLMRGTEKHRKVSRLKLGSLTFARAFQIRRLLREKRSCLALLAGMFVSLLVLDLGLNCYMFCRNMERDYAEDTKYEYMYQLMYQPDSVPEGAYPAFAESFSGESAGYELEVTLLGLTEENPFFPEISSGKDQSNERNNAQEREVNRISISSAVAGKFGLKTGDRIGLERTSDGKEYSFTVAEIVPYSAGLYSFMDIGEMRRLLDKEEGYYNVLYSRKSLDLETQQIYALTTREDIVKTASVLMENMTPMIGTMIMVSALLFLIVLYQMIRIMTDRAALSISLMRLFGYRDKELGKLYLNGGLAVAGIGAAVLIPLAKWIMDLIYPSLVANVACGPDFAWPGQMYISVYVGILLCCLAIQRMLASRLRQITPTEVLKRRE